jgi:anti-sigma factor RsiW
MITCEDLVERTTDYLEGALDTSGRLGYERHLAICPPCRGFVSQMRATLVVAGSIEGETLSPETRDKLLATFRAWSAER